MSPVESFLQRFHGRFPGATSEAFGGSDSSYDRRVGALKAQPGMSVLDVACGDGRLLERLHAHLDAPWLTGVDFLLMYDPHRLSVEAQQKIAVELRERIEALADGDGTLQTSSAMLMVRARGRA